MRVLTLISLLILLLGGCTGSHDSGRPAVAVSHPAQAWLTEQIAGDSFDVVTLLPSGSDPETYQPSVSTLKTVGKADALFTLGTQGFESSLTENLQSNFPDLKVIDCAAGVDKLTDSHSYSNGSRDDSSAFDPHMLASVRNSIAITAELASSLAKLHPDKEDMFRSNAARLQARLRALDDSISAKELKGKAFVIRHPSLSYFARDYGLEQIALADVSKETSPMQLKERIKKAEEKKPSVFVVEKEHASPADADMARQLGIPVIEVSLNSSEWLDDLMRIANEIDRD